MPGRALSATRCVAVAVALLLALVLAPGRVRAQTAPEELAPVRVTAPSPFGVFPSGGIPMSIEVERARARSRRTRWMTMGTVLWIAGWTGMPFWARTLLGRQSDYQRAMGAVMLLPGVGALVAAPMMAGSGLGDSGLAAYVLIFSAVVQLGGTVMFTAGVVRYLRAEQSWRRGRPVRRGPSFALVPFAPGADAGLSLAGTF